jgi:hypothetical protein
LANYLHLCKAHSNFLEGRLFRYQKLSTWY